jgi:hypothetical protein
MRTSRALYEPQRGQAVQSSTYPRFIASKEKRDFGGARQVGAMAVQKHQDIPFSKGRDAQVFQMFTNGQISGLVRCYLPGLQLLFRYLGARFSRIQALADSRAHSTGFDCSAGALMAPLSQHPSATRSWIIRGAVKLGHPSLLPADFSTVAFHLQSSAIIWAWSRRYSLPCADRH